jgi:hypothetical protein
MGTKYFYCLHCSFIHILISKCFNFFAIICEIVKLKRIAPVIQFIGEIKCILLPSQVRIKIL